MKTTRTAAETRAAAERWLEAALKDGIFIEDLIAVAAADFWHAEAADWPEEADSIDMADAAAEWAKDGAEIAERWIADERREAAAEHYIEVAEQRREFCGY